MKYAVALALPLLVAAQTVDKNAVKISSVSYSGNGCPQGSASTSISDDRTIVTLGFDGFQTYIGPGYDPTQKTKNCQLHLSLSYPSGFNFAVIDSVYHGFAELDAGVTGTFYSTYYFSENAAATTTTQTSINGGGIWADGQVYTKENLVPSEKYVRSRCGGGSSILNINNRIALTSTDSDASGVLTNDDATVAFTHQVHLKWFKC